MNSKKTQKLIMQVVLGEDASPESIITNGLEVNTDSSIDFSAGSENELSDVAGGSLSPRGTMTGTLAGNSTINAYLKSTDGTNHPAIGKFLQLAGMAENTGVELELSDTPTVKVRTTITGSISSASGVVSAIDGDTILVKTDDTFEVGDEVESGITVTAVNTNLVDVYNPDSDSTVVGSIFMHHDTNVEGIKNARANVTMSAESGALIKVAITALGQSDIINRTMTEPTITYEDSKQITFKDSNLKLSWATGEFVPVNSSIEWNVGSSPQLINDSVNPTGIDSVANVSRAEAGGSMTIYVENFDDFDPQSLKNADTVVDLSYRFGNGTNSRTVYVNQRIQFGQITTSEANGLVAFTIPFTARGSDDDETILVFK